jgi:hypothetical protein
VIVIGQFTRADFTNHEKKGWEQVNKENRATVAITITATISNANNLQTSIGGLALLTPAHGILLGARSVKSIEYDAIL